MTHRRQRHEPVGAALLAVDGVHAGYPGGPDVLDCVSMQVTAGTRLAILGANGSGKTTLLRCLSGAHKPSRGAVVSGGKPLRHNASGLRGHRQLVQLVLQDPDDQLFSADVRQDVSFGPMNLRLPLDEVAGRVDETLQLLGLTALADRAVHQLSYGERKRVAIAGAVAMRPRVLLLDEPTAGLDPVAVEQLTAALQVLEEHGTTVVLSTHDVDLAWAWADEVAIVLDGVVHHDIVTKVLTDRSLLTRARLGLPWPVELLRQLGREIDPVLPPRTAADVARLLS